jgi:single-strand DNA-binding protein
MVLGAQESGGAMSYQKAIVIGRLGRDPESKSIQGGILCHFSVATSESWTGADGTKQERTEWHSIVTFGKLAEICMKYIKKGSQILIEGKIQTRSWDGDDGQKHYRTEIVANSVTFLDSKKTEGSSKEIPY